MSSSVSSPCDRYMMVGLYAVVDYEVLIGKKGEREGWVF
jgi:hypothetical protein